MVAPYCSRTFAYSTGQRVRAARGAHQVGAGDGERQRTPAAGVLLGELTELGGRFDHSGKASRQVDGLGLRGRRRRFAAERRAAGRRRAPARGTARRPARARTPRRRWPPRRRTHRRSAACETPWRRPPSPAGRSGSRRRDRRPNPGPRSSASLAAASRSCCCSLVRRTSTAAPSALDATPFPMAGAVFRARTPLGSAACTTPAGRRPARSARRPRPGRTS